jgi:hypothetical protein
MMDGVVWNLAAVYCFDEGSTRTFILVAKREDPAVEGALTEFVLAGVLLVPSKLKSRDIL